jgi:hypothetical protein
MQPGHYSSQKDKLLRDFDRAAQLVMSFVAESYGEEYADGCLSHNSSHSI